MMNECKHNILALVGKAKKPSHGGVVVPIGKLYNKGLQIYKIKYIDSLWHSGGNKLVGTGPAAGYPMCIQVAACHRPPSPFVFFFGFFCFCLLASFAVH